MQYEQLDPTGGIGNVLRGVFDVATEGVRQLGAAELQRYGQKRYGPQFGLAADGLVQPNANTASGVRPADAPASNATPAANAVAAASNPWAWVAVGGLVVIVILVLR